MNSDVVLLVTDASGLFERHCASRSVSEVDVSSGLTLSSGMIVTSRMNVHSVMDDLPNIS